MNKTRGCIGYAVLGLTLILAGCGSTTTANGGNSPTSSSSKSSSPTKGTTGSQTNRPEVTNLNVGLPVPASTFLPVYVANAKGFFKKEGLTVHVAMFHGDADVVQALTGNSVNIVVGSLTGLVNGIKGGAPFKAVWGGFNQSDFAWYSKKPYSSIKATKGARYGISTYGSLTEALTEYAVQRAGLNPKTDIKMLQIGSSSNELAALESGRIDAGILSAPTKYSAAAQGMHLLLDEKTLTPYYAKHVVYARTTFIQKDPNTIKAFLKGLSLAVAYIQKDPSGAAKVLQKDLHFKPSDAQKAVKEDLYGWNKSGKINSEGLKFFWKVTEVLGVVKNPWPKSKWLDNHFLNTENSWLNQ